MNLENLVCTPEQSRKFAELGLFKDSVFVRWQQYVQKPWVICLRSEVPDVFIKEARPNYAGN